MARSLSVNRGRFHFVRFMAKTQVSNLYIRSEQTLSIKESKKSFRRVTSLRFWGTAREDMRRPQEPAESVVIESSHLGEKSRHPECAAATKNNTGAGLPSEE